MHERYASCSASSLARSGMFRGASASFGSCVSGAAPMTMGAALASLRGGPTGSDTIVASVLARGEMAAELVDSWLGSGMEGGAGRVLAGGSPGDDVASRRGLTPIVRAVTG